MNQNANAITTLCSHLCVGEGIVPLEPKEWTELAAKLMQLGLQPKDLFDLTEEALIETVGLSAATAERITRLLGRSASLSFALSEYENMGITVVTRADLQYPAKLKKVLGNHCPPLFYCAGDMTLLNRSYIGYVGARTVSEDDIAFTKTTVQKTVAQGYGVVSGGAKGIDTVAVEEALYLGAPAVEYLSDSMLQKMKKSATVKAVREGKLLLLSVAKPDAPFNVGMAMMRNRYVYAQSCGTVVVRSEYNKGGTWAGAVENLKNGWCKALCRDKIGYQGNRALIERGAAPIDETWDGDPNSLASPLDPMEQLSLFDL